MALRHCLRAARTARRTTSRGYLDAAQATAAAPHRQSLRTQLDSKHSMVGVLTGGSLAGSGETSHVEVLGMLGFDYLWVDVEHSSADAAAAEKLYLAAERRGMPTLTRLGEKSAGHTLKFLDAGSGGVLFPQVESAAEAEECVSWCKYPPLGVRGLAGARANGWNLAGDLSGAVERANEEVVVGVQIESLGGIENADEIIGTSGLDFVFLGPTDISSALEGVDSGDIRHPKVVKAVEDLGEKILASGKAAGTLILTPEDYVFWTQRGVSASADARADVCVLMLDAC